MLLEGDRGFFVVKDFRGQGGWLRRWGGRWLCAREVRAYRRLEGVSAVPRLLERLDDFAFALEYRPGQWLSRALKGELPDGFVEELERSVAAMHEKGVIHLDLRHRSNVLAGQDGRPGAGFAAGWRILTFRLSRNGEFGSTRIRPSRRSRPPEAGQPSPRVRGVPGVPRSAGNTPG